ncbi:SDR family NAD(P)-dependent oxidoreductase [Streptomyces montanisoli]|uniref:SDR family NAD(P)-dependent oxidoreductase n=1 Tax=Streptomyces montanisoli TaxID=2798581 RepID=A0A940M7Y7_9ACTN|nr:SDR family NAD(P)-dependent oxidoreductase [Streptomyces montanisoli]MBP0457875.1 SDR family NAD(P)-dependent oxidoreductase [Streptomyces montanisoli]
MSGVPGRPEAARRPGTALVTGASSGIGFEYARRLASLGHDLVLVARRGRRLALQAKRLRDAHGVRVEEVPADLSQDGPLAEVAERAGGGDVNLVVNSAAVNGYGPFAEADPALLTKVVALNVTAVMRLSRAALPGMLERGSGALVNVASLLAFAGSLPPSPGGLPQRTVYGGTKGFVVTFTRTLAAELAGTPVRVQLLCPGLTATEFHLTRGEEPVPGDAPRVHDSGGMDPADVVTASLAALRSGETVCVPGLDAAEAIDGLADAERDIRTAAGASLAPRYRDAGGAGCR